MWNYNLIFRHWYFFAIEIRCLRFDYDIGFANIEYILRLFLTTKKSKRTLSFASKPSSRQQRQEIEGDFIRQISQTWKMVSIFWSFFVWIQNLCIWILNGFWSFRERQHQIQSFFKSGNFTSRLETQNHIICNNSYTILLQQRATKQGIHKSNRLPAL